MQFTINVTFPNAEVQRCIIHQLRNSFKYVSYKDRKEFAKDFKCVYTTINEDSGFESLKEVEKSGEISIHLHLEVGN